MQQANHLVDLASLNAKQNSQTQSQTTRGPQTSEFTDHERDVTGYLFLRLKAVYPNKFGFVWPDEKTLNITKREHAKDIGRYSREQIDKAIEFVKKQAQEGDKRYMEPNVLLVLSALSELNRARQEHQVFLPAPKESAEAKRERKQQGLKKLDGIKSRLGFL